MIVVVVVVEADAVLVELFAWLVWQSMEGVVKDLRDGAGGSGSGVGHGHGVSVMGAPLVGAFGLRARALLLNTGAAMVPTVRSSSCVEVKLDQRGCNCRNEKGGDESLHLDCND